MTQTQSEAEFEFEWLLRQKYEFKILTLIAVLADNTSIRSYRTYCA
jgi:hypothetical protein